MAKKALVLLLGGNVGDRLLYLRKAVDLLTVKFENPILLSSIYETASWGFESEDFYNMAVVLESDIPAQDCLNITQDIEKELGRIEKSKDGDYQARMMDIDILFYGQEVVETPVLQIPHPRIEDRRFVLEPLKEIMPLYQHPKSGKSMEELWQQCPDLSRLNRLNEHI